MSNYHYVYRITNTIINKHYYGVRSSKIEPKLDLGIDYFSSSSDKEFIKEQKLNKDIFKYKIVKIFDNREDAVEMEIKLHNKFSVHINESFYNKSKQTAKGFDRNGVKFKCVVSLIDGRVKHIKLNDGLPEDHIYGVSLSCKLSFFKTFNDGKRNMSIDIFNEPIPEGFNIGAVNNWTTKKGKTIFNDGINEYFLFEDDPESKKLIKGRINTYKFSKIKGKYIFNNGCEEKYFFKNPDEKIWQAGRLEDSKIKYSRVFTEETKLKIKNSHADFSKSKHPRAKKYLLISPENITYNINGDLKHVCKELNLNRNILLEFKNNKVKRKRKTHKTLDWGLYEI